MSRGLYRHSPTPRIPRRFLTLTTVEGGGSFTADAITSKTIESGFAADSIVFATQSGSFTGDGVILRGQTGSFSADAVIFREQGTSFSADAVILRTQAASFTADAVVLRGQSSSFTADAVVSDGGAPCEDGAFQEDAFQNDAFQICPEEEAGQLTRRPNITADGRWRPRPRHVQSRRRFYIVVTGTVESSFTADAVIQREASGSFTADAVVLRTQTGSFTADAVVVLTFANSFTADAFILGWFTADAVIAGAAGDVVLFQKGNITGTGVFRRKPRLLPPQARALRHPPPMLPPIPGFVIVGAHGTSASAPSRVWNTEDGITVVDYNAGAGNNLLTSVIYAGGLWLFGGFDGAASSGILFTSTDGINWTSRTTGFVNDSVQGIAYNGSSTYVIVGEAGRIATSPTGTTWTLRTSAFPARTANAVTYGGGQFVAVGFGGDIQTSPDGITWTAQTEAVTADLHAVGYGNGRYVLGGLAGSIQYSSDGISWTSAGAGGFSADRIESIRYLNSQWIATSTGVTAGRIATSPDGITWTQQTTGFTRPGTSIGITVWDVAWGNGIYVAVGGESSVATSLDAITWTRRNNLVDGGTTPTALAIDFRGLHEFTADAVIVRGEGSFTADAVISGEGDIAATAQRQITANGRWRAKKRIDPQRKRIQFSLTVFARSGTFTADAYVVSQNYIWAYAVIQKIQTGSFTANAVTKKARSGSFVADAFIGGYHSGSFTANAVVYSTVSPEFQATTFRADAVIYNPALPAQSNPGGGAIGTVHHGGLDVVITYGGVDITADVMLREASFMTRTNGSPGPCRFFIRDNVHAYQPLTGQEITVSIGGHRVWGGYAIRSKKKFFFPAQDTTDAESVVRGWEIEGLDYNVLFQKRIIWSSAHPTTKVEFSYHVDTYDDTIIRDVFNHYLDIADAGLTLKLDRVDKPIYDQPGNHHMGTVASAGYTWQQMMSNITRATGGIYYINPDKQVVYTDADGDAVWTLTDQPSTTWDVPYRQVEILNTGSTLVNDALVWGAAAGSNRVVFSRTEDSASIAEHGRWQAGLFSSTLFRQASADRIADSYVYGTPQSLRGGKDDGVSFSCTVFFPRFHAGLKVRCVSAVHDFDRVLPIRSVELTFPTKPESPNTGIPVMKIVASHEPDQPWEIFESRWRPFTIPNFPIPDIPPIDGIVFPPGGCECGITDSFTRVVTDGFGISDAGFTWQEHSGGGTVDGSRAVLAISGNAGMLVESLNLVNPDVTMTIETTGTIGADGQVYMAMETTDSPFDEELDLTFDGSGDVVLTYLNQGTSPVGDITDSTTLAWTPTTMSYMRIEVVGLVVNGYVWKTTDPAPSVPTVTITLLEERTFDGTNIFGGNDGGGAAYTLYIDDFTIVGLDRCSENRFDNFNRVVAQSSNSAFHEPFGTSDAGYAWFAHGDSQRHVLVDGSALRFFWTTSTGGSPLIDTDSVAGPWLQPHFVMSMRFKTPTIPVGNGDYNFEVNTGQADIEMLMGIDNFIELGASGESEPFSWVDNTWYRLIWDFTYDGPEMVKVWVDGTAEPSTWTVEGADTGTGPPDTDTSLSVNVFISLGSNTTDSLYVDYIDFDYDGKPCPGCGPQNTFTDTFTRTIGPVPGGWGTSDSGSVWTVTDEAGAVVEGVDGDWGYINVSSPTVNHGANMEILASGPWDSDFEATFDIIFIGPSDGQIGIGVENSDFIAASYWFFDTSSGDVINVSGDHAAFGIAHDISYHCRWVQPYGSDAQLYVWEDPNSEPLVPTLTDIPDSGLIAGTVKYLFFNARATGGGGGLTFYLQNLVITNECHQTAGGGVISQGYLCESPTTENNRHFQLANALLSGSSQVFVEGLRMIRGSNYTEDPTGGQIVFASTLTIPEADSVYVCYTANGSVS